ncbi:hypothetical protein JOC77_002898 [Peribacillus deserti]|uniref:Spore coat protein n=1 Tax=Peribacillus deserti TaxID=673318 RepID=A0ABS2QLW8_9BACI|nr:hypothetical protein [Peribacillus deserti]MBM7693458.1 hypothetical protein [Peribacillus deserti]
MENYNRRGFFFPFGRPANYGGFSHGNHEVQGEVNNPASESTIEVYPGIDPDHANHHLHDSRSHRTLDSRHFNNQHTGIENNASQETKSSAESRQHNETESRNRQDSDNENSQQAELIQDIHTNAHSQVSHSGNSDVDVNLNVQVDTTAIAYALLCSMLATRQMTEKEFEIAVNKLEGLTNSRKDKKNRADGERKKTEGEKRKSNGRKKSSRNKAIPSAIKMYDPNKRG